MKNFVKALLISGSIAALANFAGAYAAETSNGQMPELPATQCPAGQGNADVSVAPIKKMAAPSTGEKTKATQAEAAKETPASN